MKRLIEKIVFSGLVTACRFATVPTRRSPLLAKATTDGVVRPPSAFSMTVGSPPSSTAMHEFVVPRSMPMVLPILAPLLGEVAIRGRFQLPVGRNLSLGDADVSASSGRSTANPHTGGLTVGAVAGEGSGNPILPRRKPHDPQDAGH